MTPDLDRARIKLKPKRPPKKKWVFLLKRSKKWAEFSLGVNRRIKMNDLESGQLLCVRCNDLPWKPSTFAAGVFVKDVAVTSGLEMQIVRFEPGARLPLHTHECPEFIYVLEGELILGGQHLGRGWASVASVGSVHSDVHSETGCVFVLVDRPL